VSGWTQLGSDITPATSNGMNGIVNVSLSSNGTIVAIGNNNENKTNSFVSVYQGGASGWTQLGSDITPGSSGIMNVSLSSDGTIVAIGISTPDSPDSSVSVYQRNTEVYSGWTLFGSHISSSFEGDINFGSSISLSRDGTFLAIGAPDYSIDTLKGQVRLYQSSRIQRSLDDYLTFTFDSPALGYNAKATAFNQIMLGTSTDTIVVPGDLTVTGTVSKGSGSFKIDHPLPEKENTHHLVHSFIEGPRFDNIYRDSVRLINGRAEVNIDEKFKMTEGTFVALNRDISTFTTNEETWEHVRGKVTGNTLIIECENPLSSTMVSYMVIGERQDKHVLNSSFTDKQGKLIIEPFKLRI